VDAADGGGDPGESPYTGRQVWNRQRTDFDLADPANSTLGHRQVQRWNLPEGWVISKYPAHAALVSEADFIAAQEVAVPRGPAGPAVSAGRAAGMRAVRAQAGVSLVQRQAGLPVPPRLHQRHPPRTRTAGPDDLAAELNPHETELNPRKAVPGG